MEIQAIKKHLKENKITYDELAARSGLSISTIKKIFSGISQYPRVDTMQAIERALGAVSTPTVLSDRDLNTLAKINRAEDVLGTEYVDRYLGVLELTVEQALKKK